jgi:hypothetical protein
MQGYPRAGQREIVDKIVKHEATASSGGLAGTDAARKLGCAALADASRAKGDADE